VTVKLIRWVASAIGLVFLAAQPACERHRSIPDRRNWLANCNGSVRCETLVSYTRHRLGGADILVTGCQADELRQEVMFTASWRVATASRHVFEWDAVVIDNEVFPLHGVVVKLLGCHLGKLPSRTGPYADVLVSPASFAWAAPKADNVFLPIEGQALLDHDFLAFTRLDPSTNGKAPQSVTVLVTPIMADNSDVHPNLREGDTFAWGDLRATIVRIVHNFSPFTGWVEVSLSDRPGPENDPR
jgi:hypothetical protein